MKDSVGYGYASDSTGNTYSITHANGVQWGDKTWVIGRSLVLKLSVVSTNQLGNILVAIFGLSNTMIIGYMCVKRLCSSWIVSLFAS